MTLETLIVLILLLSMIYYLFEKILKDPWVTAIATYLIMTPILVNMLGTKVVTIIVTLIVGVVLIMLIPAHKD